MQRRRIGKPALLPVYCSPAHALGEKIVLAPQLPSLQLPLRQLSSYSQPSPSTLLDRHSEVAASQYASTMLPLAALPGAVLLFGLSLASAGLGTVYRLLACMHAVGAVLLNLALYPTGICSLSVLLVGVCLVAHGAAIRNRLVLIAGAGTLLFGLAYHVRFAIAPDEFGWVALSVLGFGLIVAASYVERHRARVVAYLRRLGGGDTRGA